MILYVGKAEEKRQLQEAGVPLMWHKTIPAWNEKEMRRQKREAEKLNVQHSGCWKRMVKEESNVWKHLGYEVKADGHEHGESFT